MGKQTPLHLRLDPDTEGEIDRIVLATGLPKTEVARQMIRAGVAAIKEQGYNLQLPLRFAVMEKKTVRGGGTYPAPAVPTAALNEAGKSKTRAA